MSTASISYSSLKNASNEAKSVAKKLDSYSDSLTSKVYNKLNSYSGSWSSNLTATRSRTNEKINELNTEQAKYERYAEDLIELRDECQKVDKAVKSRVSTLTASFKSTYGIKDNVVINAINYVCTAIGNSTNVGRWLGDFHDVADGAWYALKSSIKEWYNYEGGEELIKGIVVSVLEITVGVLSVIAAILSGGTLIVVIAGVIAGVISAVNGMADFYNEVEAYNTTVTGDPARAYRQRNINSIQDYLRSTFIYEERMGVDPDDDESYYESYKEAYAEKGKFYDNLALGIDIVNLACTVVTVVNSLGNLIKNGYKWATGTAGKVTFKNNFKDIFSSNTIASFKSKFADIGQAFKSGGISVLFDYGKFMVSEFGYNLNNNFFKFDDLKSTVKSYKAILSLAKNTIKTDGQFGEVTKVVIKDIVLPGLTLFSVNTDKTSVMSDGQLKWDLLDNITVSDVWSIMDKTSDKIVGSNVWGDLYDKFAGGIDINIAVPDLSSLADMNIYIPEVDIPVLRTAA